MKGIILAGGKGTRLYPMTKSISKQLLPIYDKPMIYYPLSILLLASIKDILIISTPEHINLYDNLLGDGSNIGIHLSYIKQDKPRGLCDAFILGRDFIGTDDVCLILGDNIFYGSDLTQIMEEAMAKNTGATIFGYPVKDATSFGVVEFDDEFKVLSIEEKPQNPKSNYAIPGLYFYKNDVIDYALKVKPSPRGEVEISTLNEMYLKEHRLNVKIFPRGVAWLDTGTPSGMLKAAQFVESVQSTQGFYISCIEEIAWRRGFINDSQMFEIANKLKITDYGQYLLSFLKNK